MTKPTPADAAATVRRLQDAGHLDPATAALLLVAAGALEDRFTDGGTLTDPRQLDGAIVDPTRDDEQSTGGLGTGIVDTSRAMIVDGAVDVVLVDDSGPATIGAMLLQGRINNTTDEARVLALFDHDAHAAMVANLLYLGAAGAQSTMRRHRKYAERFDRQLGQRLGALPVPGGQS